MLMVKIQRQPMVDTKSAPSAGPTIEAIAHMLLKRPCSRARCWNGKMSPMTVNTTGWMQPAPIPCRERNTISQAMPGLAAQSAEATMKIRRPASRTGRRPRMSARRPHMGTVVVAVMR